jgi:hypothetical protein
MLQDFLTSLRQKHGIEKIILVRDDAPMIIFQRIQERMRNTKAVSLSYGPPNCPLRKKSVDNLHGLSNKKVVPSKELLLSSFFDDVAPGLRARILEKNKTASTTVTPLTKQVLVGSILDTATSVQKERSNDGARRKSKKDRMIFSDKMETFLGGATDSIVETLAISPQESRWTARTA